MLPFVAIGAAFLGYLAGSFVQTQLDHREKYEDHEPRHLQTRGLLGHLPRLSHPTAKTVEERAEGLAGNVRLLPDRPASRERPLRWLTARRSLAGAAAVALIVLSACEPISEPSPGDTGDQLVVLFGDSLSSMSGAETRQLFEDDSDLQLSFNAASGYQFDDWINHYGSVPQGSTVLLFLGTNDLGNEGWDQARDDAITAIDLVKQAGATRVILPTINTTSRYPNVNPDMYVMRTLAYNDWLRNYPGIEVAEWEQISQGHTDWLASDGIHHNITGQTAYSNFNYEASQP